MLYVYINQTTSEKEMININSSRILKTFIYCMAILTLVSCLVFLTDLNFKFEDPRNIKGKSISFLGDSITTFEGYSNNVKYNSTIGNNAVWYNASKLNVNETYWKQTVDDFELDLVVNNSWSGSQCSGTGESAACNTRATQLHDASGKEPEIIVVYIGINDFDGGVAVGSYNNVKDIYDPDTKSYIGDTTKFAPAYATMIHKMKQRYPEANIYVCNLLPNNVNTNYTMLSTYNAYIEKIANEFDCTLVDLYNDSGIDQTNFTSYTFEGLHPNASGHSLMAACLENKLLEKYKFK